ncbi:MAG: NapC/NirT family cytochrome c [Rhodanobacter sp.]
MFKRLRRGWGWLRRPNAHIALGLVILISGIGALTLWAGFSTFLHYSSSPAFCTSCHEMQAYVYQEYKQSAHYSNAYGVRATCSDCHVARALGPKLIRKIRATFVEVPSHFMGTLDTPEKFEAKRLELAEHVWAGMKANDSRECRECHNRSAMAMQSQAPRARAEHEDALKTGETCIDCHKGIVHHKPAMSGKKDDQEAVFTL